MRSPFAVPLLWAGDCCYLRASRRNPTCLPSHAVYLLLCYSSHLLFMCLSCCFVTLLVYVCILVSSGATALMFRNGFSALKARSLRRHSHPRRNSYIILVLRLCTIIIIIIIIIIIVIIIIVIIIVITFITNVKTGLLHAFPWACQMR